jgi:thiamine-monophosphate kinase
LFDGLLDYAEAGEVAIIGGDTSSSADSLFIDTIAIGDCPVGQAIRRNGAQAGDIIYVTGALGSSTAGLKLLERGHRLTDDAAINDEDEMSRARRSAMLKHHPPAPHLALGRVIGERHLATAMIDVSDGLSTDLTHILDESHCGAVLRAAAIPLADAARALAGELNVEPLALALHGGEEYELLFTARAEHHEEISRLSNEAGVMITAIGEITVGTGLQLERDGKVERLRPSGYEHHI